MSMLLGPYSCTSSSVSARLAGCASAVRATKGAARLLAAAPAAAATKVRRSMGGSGSGCCPPWMHIPDQGPVTPAEPLDGAARRRQPARMDASPSLTIAAFTAPGDRAARLRAVLAAIAPGPVWISVMPTDQALAALAAAEARPGPAPLLGVPFAVKDNIDVAGLPTTAACPAFAYTPTRSAAAVERLVAAGAIPVGKTNLDQFATGLNGTRSPYGSPALRVRPGAGVGRLDPPAPPSPSPPGSCPSRWGRTPPAPAGCRPLSTTWSG